MRLIDSVWMAIAEDAEDDTEGVCGVMINTQWYPLIAADPERLEFIRQKAQDVAVSSGKRVKIIRLTTREEVEMFDGRGHGRRKKP